MLLKWILFLHFAVVSVLAVLQEEQIEDAVPKPDEESLATAEKKLSDQILLILDHYKQEDPVGIPGVPIPDPMPIPPLKHSFSVATMNFKDVNVYGLSKFKIVSMKSDLNAMQVKVALTIDTMLVRGNYTMSTWISKSQGPFTVKMTNVFVEGVARLEVERDGKLQAQDIQMDISFQTIDMNFENLGFMGSVFQSIINSVGNFLFDSIKPFILDQANQNIRGDLNREISKIPSTFPNSIPPFDMAVAQARKYVRDKGYDPYKIDDYNHTIGLFDIQMTHTWLTGLSSFYRSGDITIELIDKKTIRAMADVGTQKLKGSSHWEIGVIGGMLSRAGTVEFSVEYFKVQIALNQSVDTRNHPILDDLQLDLGNIQVRCNGAGTADYLIEFVINVLPNLLRYQIMDALEGPVKQRIQEKLDLINVEKIAREKLPMLDAAQKNGFKF